MATEIKKPVVRVTRGEYRVLYASGNKAKQIRVAILPGDVLEFSEKRGRVKFQLGIEAAFRYAVRIHAALECLKKAAGKKKKKRK